MDYKMVDKLARRIAPDARTPDKLAAMVTSQLEHYNQVAADRGLGAAWRDAGPGGQFIMGLGFSEFLAPPFTYDDAELRIAETLRLVALDMLGVRAFELYKAIEAIYGREVR